MHACMPEIKRVQSNIDRLGRLPAWACLHACSRRKISVLYLALYAYTMTLYR